MDFLRGALRFPSTEDEVTQPILAGIAPDSSPADTAVGISVRESAVLPPERPLRSRGNTKGRQGFVGRIAQVVRLRPGDGLGAFGDQQGGRRAVGKIPLEVRPFG